MREINANMKKLQKVTMGIPEKYWKEKESNR